MKKFAPGLLAGTTALVLSAAIVPAAHATTGSDTSGGAPAASSQQNDNRPGPLTKKQDKLRAKALATIRNGGTPKARKGGGATLQLKKGNGASTYYEFPVNRTDKILTFLGQFSDFPHNNIAAPDRTKDNSTTWVPDYNKAHYDDMFMGSGDSFHDYYKQLSAGKYDVSLTTEDWVDVPGTAASYGANDDDKRAWQFISDTGNAWYAQQKAAGKSDADIKSYLAQFDQWDRYDHDNDGNFNEPDGYIDHFQAIHSGQGEEAGGGALGEDAIWSHRWYVGTGYGRSGPQGNLLGGTQIGDTGLWIGDYTVEPENGGLGVFAHEFGHDLGLPDYYDTAGGDNSTAFWTLMSGGSWLNHGGTDGIGTTPGLMGPEEKAELGWLDYSTVNSGQSGRFKLGPSQHQYDNPATPKNEGDQAVKVNLPDKLTTTTYTAPPEGAHAWWSGRDDNLNQTLTRSVPAGQTVTVSAQAWYQIEQDYDYLFAEYSTDGGTTWHDAATPVTGSSDWTTISATYQAGGQPTLFRFRYATDGGVNEAGAFLDTISVAVDGTNVLTDGAESGDNGWTVKGWTASTGTDSKVSPQYFWLENRQYVGYDKTQAEGPYNFSEGVTRPNWVEFFKDQPGMLVWYVDLSYANNNTSAAPGHGAVLPVDAHPKAFRFPDGTKPSNRRQPFDATFGLTPVPETCLHKQKLVSGELQTLAACAPANAGISTFKDSGEDAYYDPTNPQGSTKLPGSGVSARVMSQSGDSLTVLVQNPAV